MSVCDKHGALARHVLAVAANRIQLNVDLAATRLGRSPELNENSAREVLSAPVEPDVPVGEAVDAAVVS